MCPNAKIVKNPANRLKVHKVRTLKITTFFCRSSVDCAFGTTGRDCFLSTRPPKGECTVFIADAPDFRFGLEPFSGLRGDPGRIGPALAVRLLFEAVEVTDSASELRLVFDLFFAIRNASYFCLRIL